MSFNSYLLTRIQELLKRGPVYTPTELDNYFSQVLEKMKKAQSNILYLNKPLIVDKDTEVDIPLIIIPMQDSTTTDELFPLLRTPIYERQYITDNTSLNSLQAVYTQFINDTQIAHTKVNTILFQYITQDNTEILVYSKDEKLYAYNIVSDEYLGIIGSYDRHNGTITLDDTQYEISQNTVCVIKSDILCTIEFLVYFDVPFESARVFAEANDYHQKVGIIDTALSIRQGGEQERWLRDTMIPEYFSNKWKEVTVTSITDNTIQRTINLFGDEVEINKALEHCSKTLCFNTGKTYKLKDSIRVISSPVKVYLDSYSNLGELEFEIHFTEEKPVFEIHTDYFENKVGITVYVKDFTDIKPVIIYTTTPGIYRNIEADMCNAFIEAYTDNITLQNIASTVQTTFGEIVGDNIVLEYISAYRDNQTPKTDTAGIVLSAVNNVSVKYCRIVNFDFGILMQGSNNCSISDTILKEIYKGIYVDSSNNIDLKRIVIEPEVDIDITAYYVRIDASNDVSINQIKCETYTSVDTYIGIMASDKITTANSSFKGPTKKALEIDASGHININNCLFEIDTEQPYEDILLFIDSNQITLQDCTIYLYDSNYTSKTLLFLFCSESNIHNCIINAEGQQLINITSSDRIQFSHNQVEFFGNNIDSIIGHLEDSSSDITNNTFIAYNTIDGFILSACHNAHINGNVIKGIANNEVSIQFSADSVIIMNNTTGTGNFRVNVDPSIPSTDYLVANNT